MEGLNMHYDNNKNNLIIFIHGLFGSDETWLNNESQHLTDILYKQKKIEDSFDLANFNYNSKKIKGKFLKRTRQLNIKKLAILLRTEINARCEKYENIILIGHSMGGLIAKQYILDNLDQNKVKLYISIATPHLGSNIADFIKFYKHPQISDLEINNNYLIDLNRLWLSSKKKLPKCYYLYGLHDVIVNQFSSVPDSNIDAKYINGFSENHTSIVKLSEKSTLFIALIKILNEFYIKMNLTNILILNNSKKIVEDEESLEKFKDKGYQLIKSFSEKIRKDIFNSSGIETTTLKDKKLFEKYLIEYIKKLSGYSKATKKIVYAGISLTPLTFLEGYHLKTIRETESLAYYSRDTKYDGFKELKHGKKDEDIFEKCDIDLLGDSCPEVSINLSSSFKGTEFPILKAKIAPILNYIRVPIERDHITHHEQVEKVADDFIQYLRDLKSEKNVQRINVFAAIPVPLSFEIGKRIENHDPDIYVYHYQGNQFEWGLNIKTGELEIL